ncbi:chemotaxis protein [Undibacterium sp. RTI2.1]|uniref:chemotaxis protein n=1 Tax=unclassified Undibacterium TaxID=2630295 RepID=UPI002AB33B70|nr:MULTISPECIES: chemotaxis protein [unclassified Undibacterium]MDY7538010.1 chemotaxis protein [Undibacterium sp. 5I1]MEB0032011.1 chemotaxis protein [Undibacterium sp. RTI2.1]MEB0117207.1 chemotaxis protein [Undibacterium sp. RTI2.2]MEB0233193.1 chemotaxis protein [Undibacterium sp. 10I3]MEB0257501.1 chemotaxis protein [Undibacterium sp. 5I1]
MSKKKVLGSHVKELLSGVSSHGNEHLLEVETDLVQTTILLAEAIEKLGASFLALHAAITSQQEEIDLVISSGAAPTASIDRLKVIQVDIAVHINAAVTSLQFQDLTSQLISRTVQRSAGLREVLSNLGLVGDGIPLDSETDEIALLLKDITQRLEKQSIELKSLLRKAVNQKHLDSGDIELF